MKYSNSLFIIMALFVFACGETNEPKTTTVSGEIINPVNAMVTFRYEGQSLKDSLDAKNQFSRTLDITEPTEIIFGHGDEIARMYVRPGDQLFLKLDPAQFDETLVYTGIGSENNNYKAALTLMEDTLMNWQAIFALPEDSFLLMTERTKSLKTEALDQFKITDEIFIIKVKGDLKWGVFNDKLNYENYHRRLLNLDSFSVSAGFYDFEKEINLEDSTQLQFGGFHNYVDRKVHDETLAKYKSRVDTTQDFYDVYLNVMEEMVPLEALREEFYRDMIKYNYGEFSDEQKVQLIAAWKNQHPSAKNTAEIEKVLADLQRLEKGKPAPDFTYESVTGDTVSLSDFRGKLVYIDVWATWCGPCIGEQPAMEKLQKRFEGKDVVFIAVGTDQSPEPWKKMIEDRNLGGVHLFSPNAWEGTIMKDYVINSIPRFILIDQHGNIVDADAARPSGNIGDQIEELLQAS